MKIQGPRNKLKDQKVATKKYIRPKDSRLPSHDQNRKKLSCEIQTLTAIA